MLDRNAAMGTLLLNGCDDTRLTISPFNGSDPRGVPQRRFLAVGGGDEPGFDIPSAGERRHEQAQLEPLVLQQRAPVHYSGATEISRLPFAPTIKSTFFTPRARAWPMAALVFICT